MTFMWIVRGLEMALKEQILWKGYEGYEKKIQLYSNKLKKS